MRYADAKDRIEVSMLRSKGVMGVKLASETRSVDTFRARIAQLKENIDYLNALYQGVNDWDITWPLFAKFYDWHVLPIISELGIPFEVNTVACYSQKDHATEYIKALKALKEKLP